MTKSTRDAQFETTMPRRIRLPAVEIGLALAVTFAAIVQLMSSMTSRESREGSENAGLVRPSN
ncbi:MAG: hypothetical protein K2Y05_06315 [Hyphomicrobiaceae bacterium]|nr:hypothetical protein [Hyphomicrobiaceae bacterium]